MTVAGASEAESERSLSRLYEEVAFIAYHFHWSHDEILELPHWERRRWCAEISHINDRLSEGEA